MIISASASMVPWVGGVLHSYDVETADLQFAACFGISEMGCFVLYTQPSHRMTSPYESLPLLSMLLPCSRNPRKIPNRQV